MSRICTFTDCGRPHLANGFCSGHHQQAKKGKPITRLKADMEYQTRRSNRAYFARIAREHGLTNQDVANEYGVTEAAVRQMIQRAGK